jgi:putative hemolysin
VLGILGAEIAIIVALILANGFFAASELAIVSARRSRLEKAANAGRRGARAAIALSENPDRFLASWSALGAYPRLETLSCLAITLSR